MGVVDGSKQTELLEVH